MGGIGISGNVSLDMNVQNVVGVHRYDELKDKPKINGVEVSGSKSLDDYGIASKADAEKAASDAAAALENAEQTLQTNIDAAKEAADAAQTDIDTLLPKTDFNTENTVKKYIDDNVNTLNARIDTDVVYFDTVADMMKSAYLEAGNVCLTLGFNSANDNGSSLYMLQATAPHAPYTMPSGTPYGDVIRINDNLYAVLVAGTDVYAEQLGCKAEDSSYDNAIIINQYITTYAIHFKKATYYINTYINLYDKLGAKLIGAYQSSDSNAKAGTSFSFVNSTVQIAVNAAGAFSCRLENINFICGESQAVCLYMDTTPNTQYSQFNCFVGCTFKAAENHNILNGGSVGAYLCEAELTTFENCVFMGCRALVITLNDIYSVRDIGNGSRSEHYSATYISFTKLSLFMSYMGDNIITLEAVNDINFDNAYTQFIPYSTYNDEMNRNIIRLCSQSGNFITNVNGIFTCEEANEPNGPVTALNYDNSLKMCSTFANNIKMNIVHKADIALHVSLNMSKSDIQFLGTYTQALDMASGSYACSLNTMRFTGADSIGNIRNMLQNEIFGLNFEGADYNTREGNLGGIARWPSAKVFKYEMGTFFRYDYGKPTINNVPEGTVSFNTRIHALATDPIAYVFNNGEWKAISSSSN